MYLKKILTLFIFCTSLLITPAYAEEQVPQEVHDMVPSLKSWGNNAILVTAVKKQNAKSMSLSEIKNKDASWMKTTGVNSFMNSLLTNTAANELKKLESSKPYFSEIFLMDNQGANVAMTNKTSDYWQGDEAKFKNSFNAGQGGIDIGKVKFDKSSQAYLVQVSVAVMDGDKAIGAITIGINLDELSK